VSTKAGQVQFEEALRHHAKVRQIYDVLRHRDCIKIYGFDAYTVSAQLEAQGLWMHGYPDRALDVAQDALRAARDLHHPWMLACVLLWAAMVCAYRRDMPMCATWVDSSRALADEHGFPDWSAIGRILAGWTSALAGEPHGLDAIREGLADYEAMHARMAVTLFCIFGAEAALHLGNSAAAGDYLARGFHTAADTGEEAFLAELHRLRGELVLVEDLPLTERQREAEAHFEAAIAVAARQAAHGSELRATTSLGRLWLSTDRAAEAALRLRRIRARFEEGFDTFDLRESAQVLAKLEEP